MARRPKRPDPENHERWLISYADFITLLFAFFVVMYALSSLNEGKYKVFSASLLTVFGNAQSSQLGITTQPTQQEMLMKALVDRRDAREGERMRKQQERMREMAKSLGQVLASQVANGQVKISQSTRGVVLDISASALFNTGEAELQKKSIPAMAEVAGILASGEQAIEVEGYTDDVPIKTARFPSNWELSSARASSVVRLFTDYGVAADRLTVVGSAANSPVAPNDTQEGRARNRRVTVTILSPAFERHASQPAADSPAP